MTSLADLLATTKNFISTKRQSFSSPFAKFLADTRTKMSTDCDLFMHKISMFVNKPTSTPAKYKQMEKARPEIAQMFKDFDEWCAEHPVVYNSVSKFIFDSNLHTTLDFDQFTLPAANGDIDNAVGEFIASLSITNEIIDPEDPDESEFTSRRLKGAFILMMARFKSDSDIERLLIAHRRALAANQSEEREKIVRDFYEELQTQDEVWDVNYKPEAVVPPIDQAEKSNGNSEKKTKPKKAKADAVESESIKVVEEEEEKPVDAAAKKTTKKSKKAKAAVVAAKEEEKPAEAEAVVVEKKPKASKKKARDDAADEEKKKPAAKKAKKTAVAVAKEEEHDADEATEVVEESSSSSSSSAGSSAEKLALPLDVSAETEKK